MLANILVSESCKWCGRNLSESFLTREDWWSQTSMTQQSCEVEDVSGTDSPISRNLSRRS